MEREGLGSRAGLAAALLVLALGGCQTSGKGEQQMASASTPTGSEFDQGTLASRADGDGHAIDLQAVYFDFDRYEIRAQEKPTLVRNAQSISQSPEWGMVTIEGHCDERGSDEYNLALGERRAQNVKQYLVDLGVPEGRLRTVSFGETRPAVVGHDESAWRYNRRSYFAANTP